MIEYFRELMIKNQIFIRFESHFSGTPQHPCDPAELKWRICLTKKGQRTTLSIKRISIYIW